MEPDTNINAEMVALSKTPGVFTAAMAKLRCWRGQHAPERARVRREGLFYTGNCQTCGTPIRKLNGMPWKPYER